MTLKLIEAEIRRFLSSSDPEVLCIKGKWGVGKTFGWKKFLNEAKQKPGGVALKRYSYVSLFGLNSLEDLRFSVFESTVSGERIGTSPDEASFSQLVDKSGDLTRKMKPAIEAISAFFNRKGVADVLFKSAFLTVQNQIVCLDDLERAGGGLNTRDVLGLASFLKEERKCKIVLLLNDKEHDEKDEFERQLEKVADVTLVFDLTPEEAVGIALVGNGRVATLLRARIVELGVTNIRVIKKIERLADRLVKLLDGLDEGLVDQAVSTLALASWSVQQPSEAPPIEFLRSYNRIAIAMRGGREEVDTATAKHRKLIEGYPYRGADALDHLVIDGAVVGFFQDKALREVAEEVQRERRLRSRDSAFAKAWDELYHGSLATEDDVFLDAIHQSAIDEAAVISPLNINSAIRMLREYGRADQADEVIAAYVIAHQSDGVDFFEIRHHHFTTEDKLDPGLKEAFAARRRAFIDARNPLDVLNTVGARRTWSDADVSLFGKQTTDNFEQMFETITGENIKPAIQMVLAIGNGHYAEAPGIRTAAKEALRRIAAKSPLRARKVEGLGVDLTEDAQPAEEAPDGA